MGQVLGVGITRHRVFVLGLRVFCLVLGFQAFGIVSCTQLAYSRLNKDSHGRVNHVTGPNAAAQSMLPALHSISPCFLVGVQVKDLVGGMDPVTSASRMQDDAQTPQALMVHVCIMVCYSLLQYVIVCYNINPELEI